MQHRTARILTAATCAAVLSLPDGARAQDPVVTEEVGEDSGPPTSLAFSLNQDVFFGFYAVAQVGVSLSEIVDLTFYSIIWTSPGLGSEGGNLWTEWGGGLNFNLLDGNLSVNPQFGILSGTLLSGADRGLFLDGIVPNLTVTYGDGLLEGQIYAGFYIGTRTQGDSSNNDFIHYWANLGVAPVSWLSAGVHWEHLIQNRGAANNDVDDVYQWIGPYIEAKASVGFLRFAAGADVAPDDVADFYKVSVGATF